jgi:hypothetical protein
MQGGKASTIGEGELGDTVRFGVGFQREVQSTLYFLNAL